MRTTRRWVNHDNEKRPICPTTGRLASVTDPRTWTTLEEAQHTRQPLGYVLGNGIGCIDLDHCLDNNGHPNTTAQQIIDHYPGSYIEISPSGHGLHIWGTAPELAGIRRTWRGQAIEFYSRARYITVTGRIYQPGDLLPL